MTTDISKITLENLNKYDKGIIRKCLICGKEFEATYRKQVVCNIRCRQKLYYKNRKKCE